MSMRDDLGISARKGDLGGKKQPYGRSAYHRHFAGYTEVQVPRKDGKGMRTERVYTSDYHRQNLPASRRMLLRILYALLLAGAAWLYARAALAWVPGNSFWGVTLAQAASAAALAWMAIALFNYCLVWQDYTIGEFRSGPRALRRASLVATVTLGALTLISALFAILGDQGGSELSGAASYLAASLLILTQHFIEGRVPYVMVPSPYENSGGGEDIW